MTQHAQPPWWLRRNLTPVGRLLADYARDTGCTTLQELAELTGIKQQSLSEYLAPNGRIPRQRALRRIAEATRSAAAHSGVPGIPAITLYNAAGMTLYNGQGFVGAPPPEQTVAPLAPPPGTTGDMWEGFYQHLERMHADGKLSREDAERLMNEAENIRRGYDPMRKHIIAEHVVPEFPPAELPSAAPTLHAFAATSDDESEHEPT